MATSGDPKRLGGLKSWKIPEKPVVPQPDEEGTFNSLFNTPLFPRADFLHYASCITSYVISFKFTNITYHILLETPQKEKVDPQIPPSPQTPSGKSRPKCKNCKQYMLGHNKVACAALKSSSHFGTLEIKKAFKFQYVFVTVI